MFKKVLIASAELAPFAYTSERGTIFSKIVPHLCNNFEISFIIPFHSVIGNFGNSIKETEISFQVPVSDKMEPVKIWTSKFPGSNCDVYFVESKFFRRDSLYGNGDQGYPDNAERFVYFSRAVCEFANRMNFDIIHCNEWHTALIPMYIKEVYQPKHKMNDIKTVITIQDLKEQGIFWVYDLHILNMGWEIFTPDKLEFYNQLNFLKGGIVYSDAVILKNDNMIKDINNPLEKEGLEGVFSCYLNKIKAIGCNGDIPISCLNAAEQYSTVYNEIFEKH